MLVSFMGFPFIFSGDLGLGLGLRFIRTPANLFPDIQDGKIDLGEVGEFHESIGRERVESTENTHVPKIIFDWWYVIARADIDVVSSKVCSYSWRQLRIDRNFNVCHCPTRKLGIRKYWMATTNFGLTSSQYPWEILLFSDVRRHMIFVDSKAVSMSKISHNNKNTTIFSNFSVLYL